LQNKCKFLGFGHGRGGEEKPVLILEVRKKEVSFYAFQ
jgi:hypothetical protein